LSITGKKTPKNRFYYEA